jgi:hypothetical protein
VLFGSFGSVTLVLGRLSFGGELFAELLDLGLGLGRFTSGVQEAVTGALRLGLHRPRRLRDPDRQKVVDVAPV